MKLLRITILLLIGIVILGSISQALFNVPSTIALVSLTVVFLAPVSILSLPALQRRSIFFSATLWLMLYFFLQLVLILQGIPTNTLLIYYYVVEIALLLAAIGLAYKIGAWLSQVEEQAVYSAITQTILDIPTLDQVESVIHNEITRSRHYERPLALIAFHINNTDSDTLFANWRYDFSQSILRQSQQAHLAAHLRQHKQRYHQLVRDTKTEYFYLVCPELDCVAAEKLGHNVCETFSTQTSIPARFASASFPEDGFTFNKIHKEVLHRMMVTQISNDHAPPIKSQEISG